MKDRIEKLIELVANACMPWIMKKDGAVQFVDPLDQEEISAHYGATHAAAAFIIYGKEKKNQKTIELGENLLFSILDRWEKSRMLPGFHNDFNNFALCVLDSYTKEYRDRIREIVLRTDDSNHDTVNWLPMRWYVNKSRYEWTGNKKYLDCCKVCAKKIKKSTYSDGFIDDRLPVGMSFNLQYDVATVAVMQFLRISGEEIDLSRETGALINAVYPDGDINYFGRGTNQIFAWGLWVYLLASAELNELDRGLSYLENRLPTMLKKHNLMLNDYPGEEKYMWWDYHYCSVYTAHLLLWLVLALLDSGKKKIVPSLVTDGSSGVHIYKNDNAFIVSINGRTEYLAERGPVIVALWTKKHGAIIKGAFGPWKGSFGNKYVRSGTTIRNVCGLLQVKIKKHYFVDRYLRKIYPLTNVTYRIMVQTLFAPIDVMTKDSSVIISWSAKDKGLKTMLIPVICDVLDAKVVVDGNVVNTTTTSMIKNQYGWVKVFQTGELNGSQWELVIESKD